MGGPKFSCEPRQGAGFTNRRCVSKVGNTEKENNAPGWSLAQAIPQFSSQDPQWVGEAGPKEGAQVGPRAGDGEPLPSSAAHPHVCGVSAPASWGNKAGGVWTGVPASGVCGHCPDLGVLFPRPPALVLADSPPPPSSPGGGAHLAHQLLGPSVLGASPSASALFPAPPPRTPPAPVLRPLCSWSYVSACPHPCLPRPSLPFQGLGLLHLAFAHCLVDAHGPSESLRCGSASAPMVWGLCPPPRDPQGCPTEHHPPSSPVLALLTLFGLVVTRRGCRERTPLGI